MLSWEPSLTARSTSFSATTCDGHARAHARFHEHTRRHTQARTHTHHTPTQLLPLPAHLGRSSLGEVTAHDVHNALAGHDVPQAVARQHNELVPSLHVHLCANSEQQRAPPKKNADTRHTHTHAADTHLECVRHTRHQVRGEAAAGEGRGVQPTVLLHTAAALEVRVSQSPRHRCRTRGHTQVSWGCVRSLGSVRGGLSPSSPFTRDTIVQFTHSFAISNTNGSSKSIAFSLCSASSFSFTIQPPAPSIRSRSDCTHTHHAKVPEIQKHSKHIHNAERT